MPIQVCIPPALCALHNFIIRHDPEDVENEDEDEDEFGAELGAVDDEEIDEDRFGYLGFGAITRRIRRQATKKRDAIASQMWEEYQALLATRSTEM